MRKLNVHIKTLISNLEKQGIKFYFDETTQKLLTNNGLINGIEEYEERRLENVVFEKDGLEYKIYEGMFFRESGQCKYFKKVKDDFVLEDYTDKLFYEDQEFLILKWFDKKLKNK